MLFHEIYGNYFQVITAILEEALEGSLTEQRIGAIISEKAFGESMLNIQPALRTGEWPFFDENLKTPIKEAPFMPLTLLEKRWLKALLSDPRIRLFFPASAPIADFGTRMEKLFSDIEPLYSQEALVYYDRYSDGDPFTDETYIENFRMILTSLKEKRKLQIWFNDRHGNKHMRIAVPYRLEYSSKDDKFRLLTAGKGAPLTVNLGRISRCRLLEYYKDSELHLPDLKKEEVLLELKDERNALERAMLHFSHLQKETRRLEENIYRIRLFYDIEDETEILIRILAFGPMLKVLEPESFVEKIRRRLRLQAQKGQSR